MKKYLFFLFGVVFIVGSVVITNNAEARYPSFVNGPSRLAIREIGTWTVNAYDPDGDLASITVNWGDNTSTTVFISGASTTKIFTKSYPRIGTKSISFTIRDATGLSTKTVWAVNVTRLVQARVLTTVITPSSSTLSVSKIGSGLGLISSNPSGINCGSDCSETYASGTLVTLYASAATSSPSSVFAGWGGDCGFATTTSCVLKMNSNKNVTVWFTPILTPTSSLSSLSVSKTNSSFGSVSSNPSGISSGPSSAPVDIIPTLNVVVTSTPSSSTLSVSKIGSGLGLISSNPSGINCGSDCSETYASGTLVTLNASTATSSPASVFAGWGGDCGFSTTTICTFIMNSSKSVTATFNSVPVSVNIPTILSVSGPSSVLVDTKSTWNVSIFDYDGSPKNINVMWDDGEYGYQDFTSVIGVTTTISFSHLYAVIEKKTISFLVNDGFVDTVLTLDIDVVKEGILNETKPINNDTSSGVSAELLRILKLQVDNLRRQIEALLMR